MKRKTFLMTILGALFVPKLFADSVKKPLKMPKCKPMLGKWFRERREEMYPVSLPKYLQEIQDYKNKKNSEIIRAINFYKGDKWKTK